VVPQPVSAGGTGAATKALARVALDGGATVLSDAATIATDASLNDRFSVVVAGNRILGAPTNITAGAEYRWYLKENGTGGFTVTLDPIFIQAVGDTFAMLTTANATTLLVAFAETTSRLLVSSKQYT
jgi:hypothetical protein